ncbi:molecular chaperone TorD family protein [Vibrio sp. SCSIO 43136]|uniref:TorD/DmsD family molecular chaperone n=1 Tax=Vibrio sp. SCSIO 43136 TaxID=2819101 RepID=UPI002075BFE6|nr:molecular chaperone TorD family protein [Vibrio sp. SCSIO 43136]
MRSEIYAMLAALLRNAPNQQQLDWLSTLELQGVEHQPMKMAWRKLKQEAQNITTEQVEQEYQDLFIGIGRGEVMPFASWHLTGSLMEKPLAMIRDDLIRLGFERSEHTKEPEDHIAALCEVMAMIDNDTQAFHFFNQHIQPWFASLVEQIEQTKNGQFYLGVAAVLNQFLQLEQTRFAQIPVREKI